MMQRHHHIIIIIISDQALLPAAFLVVITIQASLCNYLRPVSLRTAQPMMARTITSHAINTPTRPMVTVYMNMASNP